MLKAVLGELRKIMVIDTPERWTGFIVLGFVAFAVIAFAEAWLR